MVMGAGFSGSAAQSHGLGDLPESCIASVLERLEASEICRAARVNTTFRRASLSDGIWASKLPENHQILLDKVFAATAAAAAACSKPITKKEIYARLTTPLRFASDTKEVWLDRRRGGICMAISWKGLKITGVDDRRYWSHISTHESRFGTAAYLQQIWWLEVEGGVEFEFPVGSYSVFFRLQLGRPSSGRRSSTSNADKIHGWDVKPVTFQLESSNICRDHAKYERFLKQEHVKWVYHHVGDFVVENSAIPTSLKFSLTQIDCTHTKGGLCVDSVFVFPKSDEL